MGRKHEPPRCDEPMTWLVRANPPAFWDVQKLWTALEKKVSYAINLGTFCADAQGREGTDV